MTAYERHVWDADGGDYLRWAVQFIYAPDNASVHWLYQDIKNLIHIIAVGAKLDKQTCYRLADQISRELNDLLGDFIRSRYAPASTIASIVIYGADIEKAQHPNGWGE